MSNHSQEIARILGVQPPAPPPPRSYVAPLYCTDCGATSWWDCYCDEALADDALADDALDAEEACTGCGRFDCVCDDEFDDDDFGEFDEFCDDEWSDDYD